MVPHAEPRRVCGNSGPYWKSPTYDFSLTTNGSDVAINTEALEQVQRLGDLVLACNGRDQNVSRPTIWPDRGWAAPPSGAVVLR